jgi:hypothetical protein
MKKDFVLRFLSELVTEQKLAGAAPCAYWSKANFLRLQQNDGHSQEEMLELFGECLREQCGLNLDSCGDAGGEYVYLDDAIFSGSRVGNDLSPWIEAEAPDNTILHVVVMAIHNSGEYQAGKRLRKAVSDSGKKVEIKYWREVTVENRKAYKNKSEVLWPATIPDDDQVQAYLNQPHKFPFEARKPGGALGPFSSEEGRQLLERELLIAGVGIRALCMNPKDIMRPLGFSAFGLGFGSMIVTFRNCPNNCPLALWWGDPEATSGPLSHWYPLFPRKTYEQDVD